RISVSNNLTTAQKMALGLVINAPNTIANLLPNLDAAEGKGVFKGPEAMMANMFGTNPDGSPVYPVVPQKEATTLAAAVDGPQFEGFRNTTQDSPEVQASTEQTHNGITDEQGMRTLLPSVAIRDLSV